MGRGTVYSIILALVFFIATYNLLTLVINNKTVKGHVGDHSRKMSLTDPVVKMPENLNKQVKTKRYFHIALTATSETYSQWQSRIMYYWYKKKKDLPGSEMGGFTRVLHSGEPDKFMDEIPTFVVDPLPPGQDRVRSFMIKLFTDKEVLLFIIDCYYFVCRVMLS